ncbi:MAG: hypothetical protein J6X28_03360 [Bacilli bacterium]|nr:hypothetical protein [Bacilli bacterium]
MKGIKKINLYRKLAALLVAGTMACSLSACNGEVNMKSMSPSFLLELQDVKDRTLLDELLINNDLGYLEDLDIIEAADQLERYLDIMDQLKSMNFEGVRELSPLTEEQYAEAFSLPKEEIDLLIKKANYKGKDVTLLDEKMIALKQLENLYRTCNEWVRTYGQSISISFMLSSVKAALADELNLSVEDYRKVTIPPARRSASEGPVPYRIQVGDTSYTVPVGAGEIWNTINYIYEVQISTLEGDRELETYRKALNYGKTTIACGIDLGKKNQVQEEVNASYVKKYILED